MKPKKISQEQVIKKYFIAHPNISVEHKDCVPWMMKEYRDKTGQVFADPDRGIRKLHQEGFLVKENKGVYKYDPNMVETRHLEDFTPAQKKEIFKKDGYKCVMCGKGEAEGVQLYADHIKPKDLGGEAKISNGQTLCGQHNWLKKNLKQTETGKKMYIHLYELAKDEKNEEVLKFCTEILEVYEKNDMNGHIVWKK
ncbi:MAG: HNH endonuclease [Patescibacteria group bacterium]|jgi:hypothetical protein